MVNKFYAYHHIIAVSTPLNWFGLRVRDITVTTLVEMGSEWKLKKTEELLEQVYMFVFLTLQGIQQRHVKNCLSTTKNINPIIPNNYHSVFYKFPSE